MSSSAPPLPCTTFALVVYQIRSVCEDRFPSVRNSIPPPLQYPSKGFGPAFAEGLILMTYSPSIRQKLSGLLKLITAAVKTVSGAKVE